MNLFITILLWITYTISLYFSVFLLLIYIDRKNLFQEEKSSVLTPQTPCVSILVPAFNEQETIIHTLESIHHLQYSHDKLDVIVINDGSTDNTERLVKEYIKDKPHFQLISQRNKGKAAALNHGLSIARGEFFSCLDADSFVDPLTLRKMLALYKPENNPKLAIIPPAMKVSQPKNLLQRVQWLEYIVIIFIGRLASYIDSLYVAPGPFSLYRTDIIKRLGGFDETNITEDQEIAYRVQKHQYMIKQCFDGYVYTTAPGKLKPFYRQRRRWYLGSIICLHQYRDLVANRKYGDFGMMQMVKNIAGYFLAITGIALAFHFLLRPSYTWIKNLVAVQFDIMPFIRNYTPHFDILTLLLTDIQKLFIVIFLFIIGFFFFYLAHKNAQEKMLKFGWVPVIPYFVFYYLFKGTILLLCVITFTKKKKLQW